MAVVISTVLAELTTALKEAYVRPAKLDEFLWTKLDKRFDDLTSREKPLGVNIVDVVRQAHEQGWLADLIREAAEDRPQSTRLQKLVDLLPELDAAVMPIPARSQIDRPSLLCGRASQWQQVCQVAPTLVHQTLLVPGGRGQEPLHFRERVQVWLTPDPLRAIVTVHWKTPPTKLDEMIDALAIAFGTTVVSVAGVLRDRLANQNVVLLHPRINEDFEKPHFIEYYTQWLPEVLAAKTSWVLKCIQPVEWAVRENTGWYRWSWLGRNRSRERERALELIRELKSRQHERMRILDVDELLNLEEREIDQFLAGSEFPLEHQKILRKDLMDGPELPAFMFQTIDEYWKNLGGTHERT